MKKKEWKGFYVFLESPQNEQSVVFYIDERGEKTLSERRETIKTNLVNPIFSELNLKDINGFMASGNLGPGFGEGVYTKAAYINLKGKELIFGCEGQFCKSSFFDQILSTFQFLN